MFQDINIPKILIINVFISIFLLFIYFSIPIGDSGIDRKSQSTNSYSDAINRFEKISTKEDDSELKEGCNSYLKSHGRKTEKVIVVFHGFTACPEQYDLMSEEYFDEGYNVLVLRVPQHGFATLSDAQSDLDVTGLSDHIQNSIDIAEGLGDVIHVTGISGGGVQAAWALEHRDEVDRAIIVAPIFANNYFSTALTKYITKSIDLLPFDYYVWWDHQLKEKNPNIANGSYPRFSVKALEAYLRLSIDLGKSEAYMRSDKEVILVLNEADSSIANSDVESYVENWADTINASYSLYSFDKSLALPHNIIGTQHPDSKVDITHPVLLQLSQMPRF